jgi:predicted esterase
VAAGRVPAALLVCWGGLIAPELDLVTPTAALRNTRVQLVLGSRDVFATPDVVARERARLDAAGFRYEAITFEGGHRLDDVTLAGVALG